MFRISLLRVLIITLILLAFAAIAINANWGSKFGPILTAGHGVDDAASEPLVVVTPTLGNYANSSIPLSTNTTVTPDATPTNAVSMNVSTNTNFKGRLEGDPATGIVRVTDAHPAGTYAVTVRAFDSGGATTIKTFALTVTTPPTCPVSFATPVSFGIGSEPTSVAVGDFDRDGKQDLATANGFTNNVSILLGNGWGGFGSAVNFDVGGSDTTSLAVGDLNGDGKQDLAVTTGVDFVILPGNGAGGFGSATRFSAGNCPTAIAVGDFNRDGKQDVAVVNLFTDNVSILLGNGAGGFGPATNFGVYDAPGSIVVGDFNGDGKEDLAIGSVNFTVSVLLGGGNGSFGPATNFTTFNHIVSITIGDFNGDGNQDLATADSGDATLSVLLGEGTGNFGPATYFNTYFFPKSVATGDFNGDGDEDLAAADTFLDIFLGNGGGGFALTNPFNGGEGTTSVAVGDFNGDGKQDLAVGNGEGFESVSILLRNCTSVSGTVTYGNALGDPTPPRFVSNVLVSGFGSENAYTHTSYPGGTYLLEGFGTGSLVVTPAKSGGINGAITSFDAAKIAQHTSGTVLLNASQLAVADVSGNGTVSSFDAGQVARYVAALAGFGTTGNWIFSPVNRSYAPVTSNITGEDYSGLLMGEVSGNWANTGARPVGIRSSGPEKNIAVTAPRLLASPDSEILIPVAVHRAAKKEIISYEFDLKYDASVIEPQDVAADLAGTVSRGLSVVTNVIKPGLLRVVVYGALPIDDNGVLLNLKFTAVGKPRAVSPLSFERIMFNEDEERVTATGGQVELF